MIGKEGGRRLIESLRRAAARRAQCPGGTLRALVACGNKLEGEQERALGDLARLRDLAKLASRPEAPPRGRGLLSASNRHNT